MWKNKGKKGKNRSRLYQRAFFPYRTGKKDRTAEILERTGLNLNSGTITAVPITGCGREEILDAARKIGGTSAGLVEWRADFFEHSADPEAMKQLAGEIAELIGAKPLLFTYRTEAEGGRGRAEMGAYGQLLIKMSDSAAIRLFDVEGLHEDFDPTGLIGALRDKGKAVIASTHFFDRTPKKKEMEQILRKLAEEGPDIVKLAVMPSDAGDVLKLMQVTEKMHRALECPLITMAMGELGKISRISGSLTGSAVTFSSVGDSSAPGQIPLEQMTEILDVLEKKPAAGK
ncbi:MAG: type I 3-dehydroquinate dehydratase [Eubacterium sp.]|nr:type I 3-dehydroquinate dehydratase [Eubacterium sp.]